MSFNWDKARIVSKIYYLDSSGTSLEHQCKLTNRISTKTIFNYKPIHGLNYVNNGVIELPPEFTFTIGFPGTSATVRLLRALHTAGQPFRMDLVDESEAAGVYGSGEETEFKLYREIYDNCRITDKELEIVVDDVPAVIFSGFALRYSFDISPNVQVTDGTISEYFGDGGTLNANTNLFDEWITVGDGT